jgi:hypothetical protein
MHSDYYAHPEFGFLSPTPRLRRELRTAFFSVLFGIGIGAAAVIALSGNNSSDDAPLTHAGSSASVMSEQPTELGLSYNSPQAPGIDEKELNKEHTSKPDGSTPEANSENHKTNATTTCDGNNSACLNVPSAAGKPRGMRMPAANDALAIGRAPLGRPDASAGMTSAAPSTSSQRVPEDATASRSQQTAVDQADSNRLSHKRPKKIARSQNRPRQEAPSYREDRAAYRIGGGDGPVGELGRAYAHERSYGQRGFWDWSR